MRLDARYARPGARTLQLEDHAEEPTAVTRRRPVLIGLGLADDRHAGCSDSASGLDRAREPGTQLRQRPSRQALALPPLEDGGRDPVPQPPVSLAGDVLQPGFRFGDVGGADQRRQEGVVVAENDLRVAEERGFFGEEVGQLALVGLAVEVGPAGCAEDGHVGPQGLEDASPVAGAGADEQGSSGGLEQIGELPPVVG